VANHQFSLMAQYEKVLAVPEAFNGTVETLMDFLLSAEYCQMNGRFGNMHEHISLVEHMRGVFTLLVRNEVGCLCS
jgi:hypothetical protein